MEAAATAGPKSQRIFRPENAEELLRGWLLHAHKGRRRHDKAARRYDQTKFWLGGGATAVSAVVGTSVFAALQQTASQTMKFVVVIVSMLAAVLTSLSAFLNLSERAEKHRAAGVHYKMVVRELERLLSCADPVVSGNGDDIRLVLKRLDELEESAPVVPVPIYEQVEREWNSGQVEFAEKADELYHG